MLTSQFKHLIGGTLCLAGYCPEVKERRTSARHRRYGLEPCRLERALQHLARKATAVRHVEVAAGHRRTVAAQDA